MLSALIWVPTIGAALIGFFPNPMNPKRSRQIALAITFAAFIWSLILVTQFDPTGVGLQFEENLPWLEYLGLSYRLGLDGLSLPLILLNGLLTLIALYSTNEAITRPRLYYALILLLNAGVSGAFLAQDLLLFFLFYEIELIPLYLLIAIWGGARRGYAATKFLLYTAISGILILASFLGLVWLTHADSFAYQAFAGGSLPLKSQQLLLAPLLIGFAIKTPIVPFHTWLPDAHVEASTPISVMLAGVLLKLGTYGLLRFGVGLFPDAWADWSPWLATVAVVTVLYGAFSAISQTDMKKMVAFSSVAHMGYILLACAANTPVSNVGAVFQMVSHGLISALLFLLVGVVYKKAGTRDLRVLHGLLNPERGLPMIGSLMVLAVMASAGIPGMAGFIAEFIIFRGSLPVFPVQTLLCMIGTGLTAVYFLLLINRAFFGRLSEQVVNLPPVQWSDRIPAIVLAVIVVILGLLPSGLVSYSETAATALSRRVPTMNAATPLEAIAVSASSDFPTPFSINP